MRRGLVLPRRLVSLLLFGALLGGWLLFAPMQLGGQAAFVIINGNSMEPLYRRDDLVIIRAQASYKLGDIVTYRHPELGPVIHRIIGRNGERWVFQGDNNSFIDPYEPLTAELMGRSWIHIPSVGKLLTLLRQSPPLMALALGGGVIVMTLSSQSKAHKGRRGKRERPAVQPAGAGSEWALTLFGVLAMACLALAAFAFTQPLSREVTDSLSYTHQGSFRYSADAPAGLYDADSIQAGDPVFRALSRALSVEFTYQLASELPAELRGSYDLVAVLSAQNGWQRTLTLAEPQPFRGSQLTAQGTLQLSQLGSLIEQFEAQTELQRQQYTLTIIPHITIDGALGGEPLHDSFAPQLEFRVDDLQIQMLTGRGSEDALHPVQAGSLSRTRDEPNALSLLGLTLDVAMARKWALIAAALSISLAALAGRGLLRAARQSEQMRIQLRYGAMIVDIAGQPDLHTARAVRIGTIEDLAKLAERQGALILRDSSTQPARYFVQDGGATYMYRASAPGAPEAPAAIEPSRPAAPAGPADGLPWQERFLQSLRETGIAAEACRSIGISMADAYQERERSSEFAQAWNEARLTARRHHTANG